MGRSCQLACFYPVCIAAFACICYDDMFDKDKLENISPLLQLLRINPRFISFLASVGHFAEEIQQNFALFGQRGLPGLLLCRLLDTIRLCLRGKPPLMFSLHLSENCDWGDLFLLWCYSCFNMKAETRPIAIAVTLTSCVCCRPNNPQMGLVPCCWFRNLLFISTKRFTPRGQGLAAC